MSLYWFDSHCHFDFAVFDDQRESLWRRCELMGIGGLLIPAVSRQQSHGLAALCREKPWYFALGLHPCFMTEHNEADIDWLRQEIDSRPAGLVAMGEIGLDWRLADSAGLRHAQLALFEAQLQIACDRHLPVILHVVRAHEDVLALLARYRPAGGIVHAFSGDERQARRYLDLGFVLGAGALLANTAARRFQQLIPRLPISAWVLETDAPDMKPRFWDAPHNSPLTIPLLGVILARQYRLSLPQLQQQLADNLRRSIPALTAFVDHSKE